MQYSFPASDLGQQHMWVTLRDSPEGHAQPLQLEGHAADVGPLQLLIVEAAGEADPAQSTAAGPGLHWLLAGSTGQLTEQ